MRALWEAFGDQPFQSGNLDAAVVVAIAAKWLR